MTSPTDPENRSLRKLSTREIERLLDAVNRRILQELSANARISFGELGRIVGLTAPSVAERVKRLQEANVLTGFHAKVDLAKAGSATITTFVTLQCHAGRCLRREGGRKRFPEISDGYRISGDRCSLLKVNTDSIDHLEGVLDRMSEYGQTSTIFVLNSRWDE